jgi:hypothetical protein
VTSSKIERKRLAPLSDAEAFVALTAGTGQ